MDKKNLIIGAAGIAIVVLVILWWIERENNKRLESEIKDENNYSKKLEVQKLELIRTVLNQERELPQEIKDQLQDLFLRYEMQSPKVAKEITSIITLIEVNQYEKAVMSIVKVIENLLKLKLSSHEELKKIAINKDGKTRKPVFADYIKCATAIKLFNDDDTQYAELLRRNRNKEAHEVGVENVDNYNLSSLLTGITLIAKCESYSLS